MFPQKQICKYFFYSENKIKGESNHYTKMRSDGKIYVPIVVKQLDLSTIFLRSTLLTYNIQS